MPNNSNWEIQKEDIDPSDFTEEELREIIFNGLCCAKVTEVFAQEEMESRWAYNVIKHFDQVPHDRTPSDLVLEKAKELENME